MTEAEKTQLTEIINSEIHKLGQKIEELKEFTQPVEPDNAIGRISRMDAINNKSVFDASMNNALSRLDHLKQALNMINEAGYGICIGCRQTIPFERLKIRPEIRKCAGCLRE